MSQFAVGDKVFSKENKVTKRIGKPYNVMKVSATTACLEIDGFIYRNVPLGILERA